jgi:geranylgeranyl pyrophosphate synthase
MKVDPSPVASERSTQVTPVSIEDVRRPVVRDMDMLVENLLSVVGDRHPMLMAAAQQIFGAGGKKMRPMLVFLVARATMKRMQQRCGVFRGTLALISRLWHTKQS